MLYVSAGCPITSVDRHFRGQTQNEKQQTPPPGRRVTNIATDNAKSTAALKFVFFARRKHPSDATTTHTHVFVVAGKTKYVLVIFRFMSSRTTTEFRERLITIVIVIIITLKTKKQL